MKAQEIDIRMAGFALEYYCDKYMNDRIWDIIWNTCYDYSIVLKENEYLQEEYRESADICYGAL